MKKAARAMTCFALVPSAGKQRVRSEFLKATPLNSSNKNHQDDRATAFIPVDITNSGDKVAALAAIKSATADWL